MGPAIAAAILDERERRGRFATVDDLLDVRGISEARLDEAVERILTLRRSLGA